MAKESFWVNGYIEFKFPASGNYTTGTDADNPTADNISRRGVYGYYWSSSLRDGASNARNLHFNLGYASVASYALKGRLPLRLVQVKE